MMNLHERHGPRDLSKETLMRSPADGTLTSRKKGKMRFRAEKVAGRFKPSYRECYSSTVACRSAEIQG